MIQIKLSNDEIKEVLDELIEGIFNGKIKIQDDSALTQVLYKFAKARINKAITDNLIHNKKEYREQVNQHVDKYSKNVAHDIKDSANDQLSSINNKIRLLSQRVNQTSKLSQQIENNYDHFQNIKEQLDQVNIQTKNSQHSIYKLNIASKAFKTTFRTTLFTAGLLGIGMGLIISIGLFFLYKSFF